MVTPLLKKLHVLFLLIPVLYSCSVEQQIKRSARQQLLSVEGLKNAHIGISVYNEGEKKYVYNHQAEKYFVPASNTKIPTLYVAMKYLDDSLPGIKVQEYADRIILTPTGDPTLLDPEFTNQPVFDYLQKATKPIYATKDSIATSAWGSGWSWGDYDADYMPERSSLPIYSNVIWFYGMENGQPNHFPKGIEAVKNFSVKTASAGNFLTGVNRDFMANNFTMNLGAVALKEVRVPFINSVNLQWQLLSDTVHKKITLVDNVPVNHNTFTIYSQPTDSMLSLLMHRSDNFFAEQSLLMVSNTLLGKMTNYELIDTILKTDFKDLPQKPRWADGSGLSRYNLFTPQDFVTILQKMKTTFGMERIKTIFATGGTGTLSSYYKNEKGFIYAKTGTLSGVVSLSGFLYTRKNKLLIFSVLVNNHNTSSTNVRVAVEKFIRQLRQKY
ncbi:MAG: D-alanyl-D-alanine carboxypeptidase [Niabella sp.]